MKLSKDANQRMAGLTISAMLTTSLGLAVAGFLIDLNYKRRKFRVIARLNKLHKFLLSEGGGKDTNELPSLLQVAGDSGDDSWAARSAELAAASRTSGHPSGRHKAFLAKLGLV